MNTQKLLIGTVVGTIYFFLIDWLLYGMLMKDMMSYPEGFMKEKPDMLWMIIGYLIFAGAFVWIYNKGAANTTKMGEGMRYGIALGVLWGLGMNLVWYALTNGNELSTFLIDGVATIVKFAIGGIIIAYAIGVPGAGAGAGDRGKGDGGGGMA
jgi:hypothetical protein